MPAKTDPQWFRGKFGQLAYELEEARRQEVKPHHLMIRATRASIQAARLVIEGVNAGVFNHCPKLRENLRFAWAGKVKGSGGTVTVDEHGRWHIHLIADVPEDDGAPLPVETASDEQLARLWVFPIIGVVKTLQPSSFKANAGAYDWKTIRKDDQGQILGRDGKPLKYVQETLTDPDTGEPVYTWRLSGEPAYVGDDYDEADLVWHSRARVGDWADTCRVLADLIAESETGVNRGYALPDGQGGDSPSGRELADSADHRRTPEVDPPTLTGAWKRLEIIEQRSGNDLAILDGQEYRLPSKAADLLIALQEAKGQMVLADTLTKTCGKRADHIYRSLPDELKPIIDAPGKTGQGYRMK